VSGGITPRILIFGTDGDEWSASLPGRYTPGKNTSVRTIKRPGGLLK